MSIVDRAKNICLSPTTEWPAIAGETTPAGTLVTSYVLPMAAIGAIAGFIGLPFIGRTPMTMALLGAVLGLFMTVVMCFVLGVIVNALAPTFGGQKDSLQAFKVVIYSYTPMWIAGVLGLLPMLGILGILAGLYSIYLLYLGLPRLMKCPEDKSVVYTLVVIVVGIVVSIVVGLVTAAILGTGALMSGGMGMTQSGLDPNSTLGRVTSALEQSAAKMDEAQKSGDPARQAQAAMEGLGALLGGGQRVDPLQLDQLEPFVPATFASLEQSDKRSERSGLANLMVARVEATYGGGDDRAELEIVDSGGASGIMGLASWAALRGEQRTSDGTERTYQEGGRLMHEKSSTSGGMNEFGVVIGQRFMVSAKSRSLTLDALKTAVAGLELAKLEGMKDVGVSR